MKSEKAEKGRKMESNEQNLNQHTDKDLIKNKSSAKTDEKVYGKPRRVKSQRRFLKATLAVLIAFLLVITGTGTAIILPLLRDYANSYREISFITRDEVPTLPNIPTGTWVEVTGPVDDPPSMPPDTDKIITVNGIYKIDKKDPDIENILIVGTDSRNMSSMRGRSDTMIVCSYNKRTGQAKLLSLMRDALVPIEGYDVDGDGRDYDWNRLNAAYSFGGIALCINTINQVFDLDIQRFIIINFEGTENLVDACGGVNLMLTDVGNNFSTSEKAYIEASGGRVTLLDEAGSGSSYYHLDGKAALIHMRHRYGSSDYKRTERQRNVLIALYRQVVEKSDLTDIYNLIRQGFGMIMTNIPFNDMVNLAANVAANGSNMSIGSQRMPFNGTSVMFSIKDQQPVSSGGASVIKIDIKYEAKKINEYIYGK